MYVLQEWARSGVQHRWFSTIDFQPPTLPVIWQGLRVIDEFKAKKQCVYVHCKAGRGRSAVVTTCYLMKVGLSVTNFLLFPTSIVHGCLVGPYTTASFQGPFSSI